MLSQIDRMLTIKTKNFVKNSIAKNWLNFLLYFICNKNKNISKKPTYQNIYQNLLSYEI